MSFFFDNSIWDEKTLEEQMQEDKEREEEEKYQRQQQEERDLGKKRRTDQNMLYSPSSSSVLSQEQQQYYLNQSHQRHEDVSMTENEHEHPTKIDLNADPSSIEFAFIATSLDDDLMRQEKEVQELMRIEAYKKKLNYEKEQATPVNDSKNRILRLMDNSMITSNELIDKIEENKKKSKEFKITFSKLDFTIPSIVMSKIQEEYAGLFKICVMKRVEKVKTICLFDKSKVCELKCDGYHKGLCRTSVCTATCDGFHVGCPQQLVYWFFWGDEHYARLNSGAIANEGWERI